MKIMQDNNGNTYEPMKENIEHLDVTDRLLSIARGQIGMAEIPKGSNWGTHVKKYLNSVGIDFPAAWCMAFVYWAVSEACKESKVSNPLIKTGGVLRQWNEINKAYKSTTPKRGSIFIMNFGKGLGHTGIVEKVNIEKGTISTIEGNATGEDMGREGYIVCRKTRNISACKGFIVIG